VDERVNCAQIVRVGGRTALGMHAQIGSVEIIALSGRWVPRGFKQVRCRAMVVCSPLVEVVRDVERGRVGGGVFEVDYNNLYIYIYIYMG
jgi:hypothetical protein